MTATMNGTARHAAAAAWHASVAEGLPLSGVQLAEQFGKSARWGRQVIAEAREAAPDLVVAAAPETVTERQETTVEPHEVGMPAVAAAVERHEVANDVPQTDRGGTLLDTVVILAVALVAAAASYGHMYEVALLAGENLWIARAFPVTVDGLVIAALRRGDRGRGWLGLGLVVSVAANVVAQFPELATDAGPVVSAWPPLALFGTHRLLHRPH